MKLLFVLAVFLPVLLLGTIEWKIHEQNIDVHITLSSDSISLNENLILRIESFSSFDRELNQENFIENILWHSNPLEPIWKIGSQPQLITESLEGRKRSIIQINLVPLKVGALFLSALNLSFQTKAQSEHIQLLTPVFTVNVLSSDNQAKTDQLTTNLSPLLPLTPQYPIDLTLKNRELMTGPEALIKEANHNLLVIRQRTLPGQFLAFFILFSLSGWLIFKSIEQKRKNRLQFASLTPKEKALNELTALNFEDSLQKGSIKQFVTELTRICRKYIEAQFHISRPSQTTNEFLQEVSEDQQLSYQQKQLLKDILTRTDPIKFANDPLAKESSQQIKNLVEDLIKSN